MTRERLKEKPLVSVIVPVYNAQDTLKRCVDSILHQTYDLLEIILVDDGATDASGRMCDAYAEEDGRVMVLHKNNGGLMSAWMAGVDIAKGEYLCFVDSDDWVESEMVERMAGNRSEAFAHAEIICCNPIVDYSSGKKQKITHGAAPGEYTGEKLQGSIFRKILGNQNRTITMSRCMKLTAAKLIRNNLKYCDTSIRMGEDVNIILEYENTSDDLTFKCIDGIVYPHTRFYLIGKVEAAGGKGGDEISSCRVFTKDYITTVNMTVTSLAKAYNVLPNLLGGSLELGVELTTKWIQAETTNVLLNESD